MSDALEKNIQLIFPNDLSEDGLKKVKECIMQLAKECGYSDEDIQNSMITLIARIIVIADR